YDRHSVWHFLSHRLRQSFDGELCRTIGSYLRGCRSTPARTEVDDHAFFALDHRWNKMSNDVHDSNDIDIKHLPKSISRDLPQRNRCVHQCGVVYEKIRNDPRIQYRFGPRRDLVIIGHIDSVKPMWAWKCFLQFLDSFR